MSFLCCTPQANCIFSRSSFKICTNLYFIKVINGESNDIWVCFIYNSVFCGNILLTLRRYRSIPSAVGIGGGVLAKSTPPPVISHSTWAITFKLHGYIVHHKRIGLPQPWPWSHARTCILQTDNLPGPGPYGHWATKIQKIQNSKFFSIYEIS